MGITDEAHCQLLYSTEKEQNAMFLSGNSIVSRVFMQVILLRPLYVYKILIVYLL